MNAVRSERLLDALLRPSKPSQTTPGELAGVSQRYVRAVELGDNSPSLTAIFQLCQALGVTPSEVLDEVWHNSPRA